MIKTHGPCKGCLTFWKLQPPNVIPCTVLVAVQSRKPCEHSLLAGTAIRSAATALRFNWAEDINQARSPAVGHNLASWAGDLKVELDEEVYASHNLSFLCHLPGLHSRAGNHLHRYHLHHRHGRRTALQAPLPTPS